jgi:hypothetical protein
MSTPDLSPEEMRIAIAEACGWRIDWTGEIAQADPQRELVRLLRPDGVPEIAAFWHRGSKETLRLQAARYAPNYTSDLNAIAQAEQTLTGEQSTRFVEQLLRITIGGYSDTLSPAEIRPAIHATALQRCRAFLSTLPASVQANEKGNE